MNIKSITLKGIRGVRNTLPLDLNNKSILIFGDNGSGKSTISDSVEWFYSDSIEHLSSEEIEKRGKGAIRNIFMNQNDDAYVDIKFSDSSLNAIKSIDNAAKTYNSNETKAFKEYLEDSQDERLILRYNQLVEFIVATKKQKLDKLQEIIGFSEVGNIRDLLRKIGGKIKRNIKSEQFDNQKSTKQSTLIENLGKPTYTTTEFIDACNELIRPLNLNQSIKTIADVTDIIKAIEEKDDNNVSSMISFYGRVSETMKLVKENMDQEYINYQNYYNLFSPFQKEPEKLVKLSVLNLLEEGIQILRKEIFKEDICPLCEQTISKIELIRKLTVRLDDLSEISSEKEIIDDKASDLKSAIQNNYDNIRSLLKEKLLSEAELRSFKDLIQVIENNLKIFKAELDKDISQTEPLKELSLIKIKSNKLDYLIELSQKKLDELLENQKKNLKLQIYTKLFRSNDAFTDYRKIEKKHEILLKQQNTFESLFSDFILRQEEAINTFLDLFSHDINDFYCVMNPNEKVQNIKLVPLKDRTTDELLGITIEYDFFDTRTTQPIAYLSESHINCLGLSFFLASVKAFNKKNHFFVLDDVVSSYDRSHRTRFAKLLIDKFNDDYQIILLTHEQEFFELVSSSIMSKGWLINEIGWNKEDGTFTKTALIDYRSQIEEKIKKRDKSELGNLIRKYLERQLKSVTYNLDCKVSFRFNNLNEKRMAPELLDTIQSTLNKHSKELCDKAKITDFKGLPSFIANTTSHDNTFQESIEDLEVFWEETSKLIKVFYCNSCNRFVSISNIEKDNKKISCGCPDLSYEWKI
jgi:energy-coupling factor transporter ATP-binding protein EcfA2